MTEPVKDRNYEWMSNWVENHEEDCPSHNVGEIYLEPNSDGVRFWVVGCKASGCPGNAIAVYMEDRHLLPVITPIESLPNLPKFETQIKPATEIGKSFNAWWHRQILGHTQKDVEITDWRIAAHYDAAVECFCFGKEHGPAKWWYFK